MWAGGGTGRRKGLKIPRLKNHEGSIPSSPTNLRHIAKDEDCSAKLGDTEIDKRRRAVTQRYKIPVEF